MEKSMANKDKNKSGGHEVPTLPPTGQCESLRSLVFAILLHRETFPISSQPSGLVAGSYAGNCHEPHCLLFEYYLSSSSIGGTRIVSSFTECSFCYALYVLYAGCSVPTSNRSSFCWWARGTHCFCEIIPNISFASLPFITFAVSDPYPDRTHSSTQPTIH